MIEKGLAVAELAVTIAEALEAVGIGTVLSGGSVVTIYYWQRVRIQGPRLCNQCGPFRVGSDDGSARILATGERLV